MRIQSENYCLDVDVKETAAYYKRHSICSCADCRNFYSQAKRNFPQLTKFLSVFGVDISRPDELSAYAESGAVYYNFVAYTVVGRILHADKYRHIIDCGVLLTVAIDTRYIPNEQENKEYFVISVEDFWLPQNVEEQQTSKIGFFEKLKNLFSRKRPTIPPLPSKGKIVEMMYNRQLDIYLDEVIRVIYSTDKTKRYVILRDEKGLYTYQLEAIYQFDKEEWKYVFSEKSDLPAMWEPHNSLGSSMFSNEQDLLREMMLEPEYKMYFCENFCQKS